MTSALDDLISLLDLEVIEVKKGEQTLETLHSIAIGRGGAGVKNHRGDNITPFGEYRIGWIGEKSMFRRFFGLTYPSVDDAQALLTKTPIIEFCMRIS